MRPAGSGFGVGGNRDRARRRPRETLSFGGNHVRPRRDVGELELAGLIAKGSGALVIGAREFNRCAFDGPVRQRISHAAFHCAGFLRGERRRKKQHRGDHFRQYQACRARPRSYNGLERPHMSLPRFLNRFAGLTAVRRGFVGEWTVTFIFLLFGTTSLLQAFVIPSGSMENSLLVGDHVLVDKLTYSPAGSVSGHLLPYREIRRGDIIVFAYPLNTKIDYVKRAIGVPGDHIRLVNKQLFLNGKAVAEPYAVHREGSAPYRDNFPASAAPDLRPRAQEMLADHVVNGELVVPPGFIFAMGDNRDNSDDSRYWGLVPRDSIRGTPLVVYWSFDAPEEALENPNIGLDHVEDVVLHFFSKTRWSRMFHLVHGYPLG
jgi:signal peptidase I